MTREQPVDLTHLDRYTGGDRSLNEEILRLFDWQCREMIAKLEQALAGSPDAKSWREATHTLKGAARGIGAFPLGDAAALAEAQGSDGENALAALVRLKDTSAAVYTFIARFLNESPTP